MLQSLKTASVAFALSLALAGFAYPNPKDKYHGGALDAREHGYEHGYRDGLHKGLDDRDHHNKFKPEVKDDDNGYQSFMGDKGQYKEGYRSGFVAGYDDGFNNRPSRFSQIYGPYTDEASRVRGSADRYDDVYVERRFGASDVAFDMGYRDGVASGADDFNHRRNRPPQELKDFREADHGYRSNYGDKLVYQRQYRDGFEQGYRDGMRGIR